MWVIESQTGRLRSDDGGDHWAVLATLIETAKLNGVDPQAWLTATLTRLAAGHGATASAS